jgi:hypothetical protein
MANKSLYVLHTERRKTKREKSEAAVMDVLAAVPGVLWKAINNSKTSLILHEFTQLIHFCSIIYSCFRTCSNDVIRKPCACKAVFHILMFLGLPDPIR